MVYSEISNKFSYLKSVKSSINIFITWVSLKISKSSGFEIKISINLHNNNI